MIRNLKGATTTPLAPEVAALIDDFKFFSESSRDVVNQIQEVIADSNASTGVNKVEKIGDTMFAYTVKMSDRDAAEAIGSAKISYDSIGRLYRMFSVTVQESVVLKIKELQKECPAQQNEIRKLTKAKNAKDDAIDQSRRNPENAEFTAAVGTTEADYNAQVEIVKASLAKLPDMYDAFAETIKTFSLLLAQLVTDEKAEYTKMVAANKF